MAKKKGEQTNEGQTKQWPKKKGKRQMKDRQYNGQRKRGKDK
jgi:hypothetical protein